MDSLNKVLFPLLSKIQTEKEKMGRVLEQLFYYQTLLMAPAIIGLAVIMKNFIFLIPKYQKWEVALPLFYLFSFSSILVTFFSPFINFFNALGKSKISLLFMIFWTGITWIFVPWFIHNWGMIGYPVVHVLIGLTFFIVLLTAKKFVSFNFGKAVLPGLTSAAIMGIGLWLLNTHFATSWINTCLIVGSGVILYNLLLLLIFRINFFNDLTKLFQKNV
jgi:O-antigen/teichoic acid export membrane protein